VTTAIFAPTQSRVLLAGSGDPIYELCRGQETPLHPNASTSSIASQTNNNPHLPYTFHPDGNIIVSADYAGQIKVFRQDCAWTRRKPDPSDTASLRLRGRTAMGKGSSSSIRPSGWIHRNSQATGSRTGSTHSSSRRNSVDTTGTPTSQKNLEIPRTSPSRVNGREASPSPSRHFGLFKGRGKSSVDSTHLTPPSLNTSRKKSTAGDRLLLQENGQSMAFWNLHSHPAQTSAQTSDRSASVSPIPRRNGSASSGNSGSELDDEEAKSFFDARERLSADDMVCDDCGARTFNAFKVQSGPHKGETKLRCSV
jgi:WD repeat-containing protein 44